MPKCSKCGCNMPPNPPNGVKLTIGHFRGYEINDGVYKNYYESAPYGALCPDCYKEMFLGLTYYKDSTVLKTNSSTLESFTSSSADYQEQEPLHINISDFTGDKTIYKGEPATVYINNLDEISNTKI